MQLLKLYYNLKPVSPLSLRIALRRRLAKKKQISYRRIWPIQESSNNPSENWPGWPDKKRFAFILTHDVEGKLGLKQCQSLMELELARGFRSSFGIVPEGKYSVPHEFQLHLREKGFEVAVHDLEHDGRLYKSEQDFKNKALRINNYLDKWQASGFRSGLMHHNLELLKELNILYDSSTFDCDPFEPQSDGVETIFPFWISRNDGTGFVELPCTFIQDFNLFIILKEKNIDIWKKKLDWIAEHGGMALLNTHPDYMSFDEKSSIRYQYPAALYTEFLDYAKLIYGEEYWHATPLQVAKYIKNQRELSLTFHESAPSIISTRRTNTKKIWIDLDNTPHVPFFEPIMNELKKQGHSVLLTARDAYQVIDLADEKKMEFINVGHHYGKNKLAKMWGLAYRAMQLAPVIIPYAPDLAISHGARSQIFLCNLLGINSVLLADYEFGKIVPAAKPSWMIVPETMADESVTLPKSKILKYPGIKEDVYAPYLNPDASLLKDLGLEAQDIVVTVRPPATEAHYHNPASDVLFNTLMDWLNSSPLLQIVLLPRNKNQELELLGKRPDWFENGHVVIPSKAVNGMNLIWNSDLVVSGGGTMNREAAALNVPVYSIFRGPLGDIDRYLEASGKLTLIKTEDEVRSKIRLIKRPKLNHLHTSQNKTLESILNHINNILGFNV